MVASAGKRSSIAGAARDPGERGEEPFGGGRRPIQQAPKREGEHAASPGGGRGGASDVVLKAKGIYVGTSTSTASWPPGGPRSGISGCSTGPGRWPT